MKKGSSHIIRLKKENFRGKGPKPQILKCQSPVPAQPFALTIKKALKSNELDATKLYFNPPPPPEE